MSVSVPPGPPKDLHHVDVDKTEVWLVWNWPDRNGGSEITGFLVEYQEEGEKEWDEWKTVSIPESHVTGLEEGKTYRFRVRAENAIGLSRPDTTVPILCQEKLGKMQDETPTLFIRGILDRIKYKSFINVELSRFLLSLEIRGSQMLSVALVIVQISKLMYRQLVLGIS